MTMFEKTVMALAVVVIVLIIAAFGAFWWAGTVPSRPRGVAADAVFLWAPHVGLPAPKRGWWLACWEDAGHNRCKLSWINGSTEYEGEFIPYGHQGPLAADQLKIDSTKTGEETVWVGVVPVPLVYLENGEVLIPAGKYEEGVRLLEELKPRH
jgi:hypothetical protein